MIIDKVSQVTIPVTDQDRALKFYTEKLGFTLAGDYPMGDGKRWIEISIPGAETRLVLWNDESNAALLGTNSNILFNSPDIEKTASELIARDVELAHPLTTEFWGTFVMFKDPDGNTFLIAGNTVSS